MSKRYFCVHGHFYQPPREDAISGIIPKETGAAPYQNWNERIHAECYKPNAELGNFEKISFNIGPTLFNWMESYDPQTYKSIIQQEKMNVTKYGVGNAMAQAYNHVILPLASYRDKRTQIIWGIQDFVHRYGHKPDGMWLPETAVDEETLGILIDSDIKFTILAPWQAKDKSIETSRPYRVNIHNGKSIVVFFYQMDISTRLSFDPGATSNADRFLIEFLLPAYKNNSKQELLIAASDGELYGHHQQFRDKFLNRLLDRSGTNAVINNTYPARYLRDHPPRRSCKISSRTSWSCHHGVSRWSEDCGCTPGSTWKAPLRVGLNTIAEELDRVYFDQISSIELDPWLLRDDYIHVILGETPIDKWLAWFTDRKFDSDGIRWITWVMESQVARQKMFTSCGWFFDELNRIEPKNNIGYAAQATVLLEKASKENLSKSMASKLESVQSTRFDINGTDIFMEYYERGRKNLEKSVLFFP